MDFVLDLVFELDLDLAVDVDVVVDVAVAGFEERRGLAVLIPLRPRARTWHAGPFVERVRTGERLPFEVTPEGVTSKLIQE